jgi:anti-sigma-K factor RskA
MTDDRHLSEERWLLAAEYALGVLTGAELAEARALAARDGAFRAEAERWSGRLTPMLDEIASATPPRSLWRRIDTAVGGGSPAANDNIVQLRKRVGVWRGISAAMSAIAACLAIIVAVQPRSTAPPPAIQVSAAPPLVAMLGDDKQTKLVASWDPDARRLVLAVAGDMPADRSHAHELWVIPVGGAPRSLGTMGGSRQMHMSLEDTLAELMRQGSTIAISVEPPGGSPTGAPTGPVIASGTLRTA